MPSSVPLIARKPNNAPTQKFSIRAGRQGKPYSLILVGNITVFLLAHAVSAKPGRIKIPRRHDPIPK